MAPLLLKIKAVVLGQSEPARHPLDAQCELVVDEPWMKNLN